MKRWKANISAPTVRNVRGALTTQEQGIIITTSGFSKGAAAEADAIGKVPISLVDGGRLLDLLIEYGVGVNKEQHTVYSLDEEYWGELIGEPEEPKADNDEETADSPRQTVSYPIPIRAGRNLEIEALLLNAEGHIRWNGQIYTSPSGAGKAAKGVKAVNGWKYWRYQHQPSGQWHWIDELREK